MSKSIVAKLLMLQFVSSIFFVSITAIWAFSLHSTISEIEGLAFNSIPSQSELSSVQTQVESLTKDLFYVTTLTLIKDTKLLPEVIESTRVKMNSLKAQLVRLEALNLSLESGTAIKTLNETVDSIFLNAKQGLDQVSINPGFGAAFVRQAATKFVNFSTELNAISASEVSMIS